MFKNKAKFQNFVKRQVAKVLAVVMAFSSFASTGIMMNSVRADSTYINDGGEAFVDKLVEITANGVPYVWGGWQYNYPNGTSGVDCRGFVRVALRDVYGLDIFHTEGYLVDEDGNPIDKNGNQVSHANRLKIDVAAYDPRSVLNDYVGRRICVEGNGLRTYYRVAVADYCKNLKNGGGNRWSEMPGNALDINFNGSNYSSLIAYACQFPGSIISHNGHYGVGIGEFHSKNAIIDEYPGLDGDNSGNNPKDGIIRWSQSAYNVGQSYDEDDARYWFGKTVFLSACSAASGIRADNFTTTGKTPTPDEDSGLVILLCENIVKTTSITFTKVDQATGDVVIGAQYGLYKDAACTKPVTTFTTDADGVVIENIDLDVYYVKELKAPHGYELSNNVIKVDATGEEPVFVTLNDTATNATVIVRKVDSHDTSMLLDKAAFKIMEYNSADDKYHDLVTLTYISSAQAYTINSSYKNGEGTTYSDNSLHYTQSNQGKFKLIEVHSQNGYEKVENKVIEVNGKDYFNILDGGLILVGDKAVRNDALLSLVVTKVDAIDPSKKLSGAVFELTYNGKVYTATTDANGKATFSNIPEGPSLIGTLKEITPPDGYSATTSLINGMQVSFSKTTPTAVGYRTNLTVLNIPDGTVKVEPTSGQITIRKYDASRLDNPALGVPNTYYTIYADSNLTTVAKDKSGNELSRLKTDENGTIVVKDLALGIYYIREVEAPNGYAIQPKTFVINLLDDGSNTDVVKVETPMGVRDYRQVVTLGLQKIDANTKQPVAGAVYALYTNSEMLTSTYGQTIAKDTLIGYYVTGEDGYLQGYPYVDGNNNEVYSIGTHGHHVIDKYGSDELVVNGVTYDAVDVLDVEGTTVFGDPLVNGHYYFVEVAAPEGYVLDTNRYYVDASWEQNTTVYDKDVGDAVVSPSGMILMTDTVVIEEARQTIKINFNKTDVDLESANSDEWYGLDEYYNTAVSDGMAATIEGALYQLINTNDITDVITGHTIPAGTTIGLYTVKNGAFTITKMTEGAYNGHPLPNGNYKLIEIVAPQGYALSTKPITVQAPWENGTTSAQMTYSRTDADEILKQKLTISKIDGETSTALEGVSFKIYNVAHVLSACGITSEELPWNTESVQQNGYYTIDRDAFAELINTYNLTAASDLNGKSAFITDANGQITTGEFVYGDYIVYEVEALKNYIPSDAIYIQLPWVEAVTSDGSAENEGDNQTPDSMVEYVHNVVEQPSVAYGQEVINYPEDVTFNLTIIKTDADDNSPVRNNPAKFELYDANNKLVATLETNDDGNASISGLVVGQYTLREINAPVGFVSSADIIINATKTNVTVTSTNASVSHTMDTDADGNRTVSVFVPNAHEKVNVTIINKYEIKNGQRVAVDGATLQILDSNGDVVVLADGTKCEWVTSTSSTVVDEYGLPAHEIVGLQDGTYTLHEAKAPGGYATAADVTFTVSSVSVTADLEGGQQPQYVYVYMKNDPTVVQLSKIDAVSGIHVVGAKLAVINVSGDVVEEWTTNGGAHTITHLPVGDYTLREMETPFGYQKASDVQFTVSDSSETVFVTMKDIRTYGVLELNKTDSKTGEPLKDVVFNLISVNDVVDPVTNEVIYSKGQVVDVLTTDANGYAKTSKNIPIGTYGTAGEFVAIEYNLIETKAVSGSQYGIIDAVKVVFTYVNDSTPIVTVSMNLQNSKPEISVTKTGTPETYVGKYENRENVTVVKNGDIIEYTIAVQNTGLSSAWNVVVRDSVPANTTFISVEDSHNGAYDASTNTVYWDIDEIKAGNTVELKFNVKANNVSACEIVNIAEYAMPDEIPTSDEGRLDPKNDGNAWKQTNAVIHQIVEFHKTSDAVGGTNKDNAVVVNPGDTIKYFLSFTSVDTVYGAIITDVVPNGLTYIDGSARSTIALNSVEYDEATRTITFIADDPIDAETAVFEFAVTVDDMENGDHRYYENVANAQYNVRETSDETATLISEIVTHQADKKYTVVKDGTPDTYVGVAANADNITVVQKGDDIVYTITATNSGGSSVKNIVITDIVPEGLTFVGHNTPNDVSVWYDTATDMLTWCIPELKSGETISVSFTTSVDEQKAQIIVNAAYYDDVANADANAPVLVDPNKTDDVVHQVIEFHKMSEVIGGMTKDDATPVAVGDTIIYTLKLVTDGKLTNVSISDPLPNGLTLDVNSIKVKHGSDGEWAKIVSEYDVATRTIVIVNDELDVGEHYFQFNVTVDYIPVNKTEWYLNKAHVEYDEMPNNGATDRDGLESEFVSHMTDNKIKADKTGTPDTYVGPVDEKTNVTVVKDGDKITYSITVHNIGVSTVRNVVVRDSVPEHTVFVSAENNGVYNIDGDYVEWVVDEIIAGQSATVKFIVECDSDSKAVEIINVAQYAAPEDINNIKDDEWLYTDAVIHQTVELHKTSVVVGGSTKDDATVVSPGDKIHYVITFTAIDDVHNIVVTDKIPEGLTYIEGSATIDDIADDAAALSADNCLIFSAVDINSATVKFEFDVVVDEIKDHTTVYYLNQAKANYSEQGEDGEIEEIESEIVSHCADKYFSVVKHGTPATFEGDYEYHKSVTVLQKDDVITYELIATNEGHSIVHDLVVVDKIPVGLSYLSHSDVDGVKVWVDEETGLLTWHIKELAVGENVSVQFKACVKEQKAQLIINNAIYGTVNEIGDIAPTLSVDSKQTNDVVHQVVEFHKTSEVIGGIDKESATPVGIGDTIIYTLKLMSVEDLTNVCINDTLPDGLTFVPGSISVKHSTWEEWIEIADVDGYVVDANGNRMVFFNEDNVLAGNLFVQFSVTVDYIPANSSAFFINQASVKYDVVPDDIDAVPETDVLLSEQVSHMTETKIEGFKNGVTETYVGDYESRNNVTVVNNGDEIIYVITVKNAGASDMHNVVIRDAVPEHTIFKSVANDGVYNEIDNYVEWFIGELKSGESIAVEFTVVCNSDDKAVEIRNIASYAAPEDPEDIHEDEWLWTDEVIYQTVEFHKSASIKHGVDTSDAKYVAIGSKFSYILTFDATNTVYGLNVVDKIPLGLTYVPGTATYQFADGDIKDVEVTIGEENEIVFPTIHEVPAGVVTFRFDVLVEDVAEYDLDYFFINQASATVKNSKDSDTEIDLISEKVSNKTIKPNNPPKLGDDSINDTFMWGSIAFISAISMVIFGYYGFVDNKKRR